MLSWVREAVWERSEGRCERPTCRATVDRDNWEGHVHHKVYRGHGQERPEDLELICLACHAADHPHRVFRTREEQAAIARRRGRVVPRPLVRTRPRVRVEVASDFRATLLASYEHA